MHGEIHGVWNSGAALALKHAELRNFSRFSIGARYLTP
jgi:hypothetical protein